MPNLAQIVKSAVQIITSKKVEGHIKHVNGVRDSGYEQATRVSVINGKKPYDFVVPGRPSLSAGNYIIAYLPRKLFNPLKHHSHYSYGLTDNYVVTHH